MLISSRVTLPAGSTGRMSQCPMGVLTFICWPCLADCRVYKRTTNNRVKSLWLPLTIDGLRAHYWPSDERACWQVAHRWAEHGTYSWPEYGTNHRVYHTCHVLLARQTGGLDTGGERSGAWVHDKTAYPGQGSETEYDYQL